jgi:hypothetical protein
VVLDLYPHPCRIYPWVLTSQAFRNVLGIGDGREEGGVRARVGLGVLKGIRLCKIIIEQ